VTMTDGIRRTGLAALAALLLVGCAAPPATTSVAPSPSPAPAASPAVDRAAAPGVLTMCVWGLGPVLSWMRTGTDLDGSGRGGPAASCARFPQDRPNADQAAKMILTYPDPSAEGATMTITLVPTVHPWFQNLGGSTVGVNGQGRTVRYRESTTYDVGPYRVTVRAQGSGSFTVDTYIVEIAAT